MIKIIKKTDKKKIKLNKRLLNKVATKWYKCWFLVVNYMGNYEMMHFLGLMYDGPFHGNPSQRV